MEPTHPIQRVEIMRVACRKFACLEITAAQVLVAKRVRALTDKKMKAQPASIGSRHALGLPKKGDEQKEDEVSIYLCLKLKVTREIFGCDLARAALKLKRGMQRESDFFDKHDDRPDIAIGQPGARVVFFDVFNYPARIVNSDVKLVPGTP